jgi:hypothetical protein
MIPPDLEWTQETVPVKDLVQDLRVNPRNPSDKWVRDQLDSYNPALVGLFIVSERLGEGGTRELVLLDGANRQSLMRMAGVEETPVLCQVFHGLTIAQEAEIALEYNDRRSWTAVREFQNRITMGDPVAVQIRDILEASGWCVDSASVPGTVVGVKSFESLIKTACRRAADATGAHRGTETWKAGLASGEKDAMRVLRLAVEIYTEAFPERQSGHSSVIFYGLALVLLKFEGQIDLARLTENFREHSRGIRQLMSDARGAHETYGYSQPDAVAFMMVQYYNKGLARNSKHALPPFWVKMAK